MAMLITLIMGVRDGTDDEIYRKVEEGKEV
jgi:hypothetical protein